MHKYHGWIVSARDEEMNDEFTIIMVDVLDISNPGISMLVPKQVLSKL